MNVKIENYRGFDIIFNPDTERFSFDLDSGTWQEKQSYAACKKNIDDFIKENQTFAPFMVINNNNTRLNIIGIRKDNRFVAKEEKQIPEYTEKDFYLYDASFEAVFSRIDEKQSRLDILYKEINEERKKITGQTLREYKENLLKIR